MVDSLALHISLVSVAILIGYGIKQLLILTDRITPSSFSELHIMQSLPLFPLCMVVGVLLQLFLRKARLDMLADHNQMKHITGTALDFLVVAGIASIRPEFVIAYWAPLSILVLAGIIWNVFCRHVHRSAHLRERMVRTLHRRIRASHGSDRDRVDATADCRSGKQNGRDSSVRL